MSNAPASSSNLVMSELAYADKTVPQVPPVDKWSPASFLGDNFWSIVNKGEIAGAPASYDCLYPYKKSQVESLFEGSSIIRFSVERGDFPESPVNYASFSHPTFLWEEWVDDILKVDQYRLRLSKAGVLHAIRMSRSLDIARNKADLGLLISRWCSKTHTFVTSWGEFTPSLEDVSVLMCLDVYGREDIATVKLSSDENRIKDLLVEAILNFSKFKSKYAKSEVDPRKNSWQAWVRYFFRDYDPKKSSTWSDGPLRQSDCYFEAFITMWLCRYVLEGSPEGGINTRAIPFAILIAQGHKFTLAPLFLGGLYVRLDAIRSDMERSVGRYTVNTFVGAAFLQMFVFEHFPGYAPRPHKYTAKRIESHEVNGKTVKKAFQNMIARATRWSKVNTKNYLRDFIDLASAFRARPYTDRATGLHYSELFLEREVTVDFKQGEEVSFNAEVLAVAFSTHLPVLLEESRCLTSYNPSRIARQFGFDQSTPCLSVETPTFDAVCLMFTIGHGAKGFEDLIEVTFPSMGREGVNTSEYVKFWNRELQSLREFVQSPPNCRTAEPIPRGDYALRLILRKPVKARSKSATPQGVDPALLDPPHLPETRGQVKPREQETMSNPPETEDAQDLLALPAVQETTPSAPQVLKRPLLLGMRANIAKKSRTEDAMVISSSLHALLMLDGSEDDEPMGMPVYGKGKSHVDYAPLVLPVERVEGEVPQFRAIEEPREGSESSGNLRTENVGSDDEEHEGDEVVRGATPMVDDEANLDRGEVMPSEAEVTIGDASVARVDKGKGVIDFEVENLSSSPLADAADLPEMIWRDHVLTCTPFDSGDEVFERYHIKPLIGTSWKEEILDLKSGIVKFHDFHINVEFVDEVESIFSKHKEVARGCVVKHSAIRGTLIELLVQMVRLVTTNSPASLLESDIEFINQGMEDLERLGFDVSWFKPYMSKVALHVEYARVCAELDAQKRDLKDAEARVSQLRQEVSRHESIVETKGEKALKYLGERDAIIATDLL